MSAKDLTDHIGIKFLGFISLKSNVGECTEAASSLSKDHFWSLESLYCGTIGDSHYEDGVGGGRRDPHPGHVTCSTQEGGAQWAPRSRRVPLGSRARARRCMVLIVG